MTTQGTAEPRSVGVEPQFVGESRHALVDGLVNLFDQLNQHLGPRWVSLEAPSGWGKTRVGREFFGRLAARQPSSGYWPPSIVSAAAGDEVGTRRKRVNPDVVHTPGSLPTFTWWGITCSLRHGVASVALAQDAAQLEAHAPYLEDAWRKLPRTAWAAQDLRAFGSVLLDETAMEVGGRVVEAALGAAVPGLGLVRWLGEWGWNKAKTGRERRQRLASSDQVAADYTDLGDSLVEMLTRLSRPGLPTVLFIEDLHDADELLVEVCARLMSSQSSIVLLTTGWPGHLDESEALRSAMLAAGERLIRITPDAGTLPAPFPAEAGLTPLEEPALQAMLRHYYPQVTNATAQRVVERYPNPLALELFCQIPGIRRRFADRPLELTDRDIARLPASVRDLYRQLWKELPDAVRQALALATLGIPAVLDPEAGRLHWWNADLVADAVQVLELPEHAEVVEALEQAPTAYAWARVVTETLRQFFEPDQLIIAGEERDELLMPWEADEIKEALALRAADRLALAHTSAAEREHGARLLLALHAEGFVTDPQIVGTATLTMLELLRDEPRELPERIRSGRQVLPLLDPATSTALDIRRELGRSLRLAERWPEAVEVLDGLRAARRELVGAETAASLNDGYEYAAALSHTDPRACEPEVTELAAAASEVLGEADPLTLRIRNLFSAVAWELDRPAECLRNDTAVLELRTRTLGVDHPDTLTSASNRAYSLIWVGRYDEAYQLAADTYQRRLRVLGPTHEDTLLSRQELARLLGLMGRAREAVELREALLADKAESLGPDHPSTLWALDEWARALPEAGRADDAVRAFDDVVARRERTQGAGSDQTLDARSQRAWALNRAGHVSAGIAEHEEVLAATVDRYGAEHPRTFEKRYLWVVARGYTVSAGELVAELAELADDVSGALGPDAELAYRVRDSLANALDDAGRNPEAIAIFEQLWRQRVEVESPSHVAVAEATVQLAASYTVGGRHQDGVELVGEYLPWLQSGLGDSAEVIVRLRLQRAISRRTLNPELAVADVQQILVDLAHLPPGSSLVTDVRLHLALALAADQRPDRAVEVLQDLVVDVLKRLGAGHPDVVRVLSSLLGVVTSTGQGAAEAMDATKLVVDAARETLGTRSAGFRSLLRTASSAAMDTDHDREVLAWREELVDVVAADPSSTEYELAEAQVHLAYGLVVATDDLDRVTPLVVSAALVLRRVAPQAGVAHGARKLAAIVLEIQERYDEAVEFLREELAVWEATGIAEATDEAREALAALIRRRDGE